MQEIEEAEDVDMESSSSEEDTECDQWFDTNSFSCSVGGRYRPDLSSMSTEDVERYSQIMGRFMEADDPDSVVSQKKDYWCLMDLAFYMDNLEMIRKCCKTALRKFGYEEMKLLVWLYRELYEWETTKDDTILESIYSIFREALSQKYSSIVVYKFIHFAPYSAHKEEIWQYILDVYVYDFTATAKYVSFWKDFYMEDPPDSKEKYQRIVEVYKAALAIPHVDSDQTLRDFRELCDESPDTLDVNWKEIEEIHSVADSKLGSILEHEGNIVSTADLEKSRMYRKYLESPDTAGFPRKWIQFIYERMVADCSAIPGCWIAYIRYRQDMTVDVADSSGWFFNQSPFDIANRGLVFARPSEQLYSLKMELLENDNFSATSLLSVMESALRADFPSPDPITNLWIEYLTILRRHVDLQSDQGRDVLRRNFENAWESLSTQWGNLADQNGEILKIWGTLEYRDLGDAAKGKSLWNEVMSFGENSTRSATWLEFIHLEERANPTGARKIFKKAIKMPELMDPEVLAGAWVRFERLHGSRENLQYCQSLSEDILVEYKKNVEAENRKYAAMEKKNAQRWEQKNPKDLKRKSREGQAKDLTPTKKQKIEKLPTIPKVDVATPSSSTRDPTKDNVTIFVSNLDYSITQEEIQDAFSELQIVNCDMVKSASGKNRGFCYIELESEEKVKEALQFDRRPINGRPVYISGCAREKTQRGKIFKYSEELEPTKLFVKGCGAATKEELEEIFKPYGEIKDIRVVFHKNGNPKGIAYVEFMEESAASVALLKVDQYKMGKNVLSVAISAPPQRGVPKTVAKVESLGAAKRQVHPGEMRPRMAFIPRAVQQKSINNGQ
uniref:Putative squamous cell carcinoma antigen recognized by t-cells 3 n=1 Tax=Nyssomyia neivai TaxID=330878 RepID=A0A1L8E2V5_9DIPT